MCFGLQPRNSPKKSLYSRLKGIHNAFDIHVAVMGRGCHPCPPQSVQADDFQASKSSRSLIIDRMTTFYKKKQQLLDYVTCSIFNDDLEEIFCRPIDEIYAIKTTKTQNAQISR